MSSPGPAGAETGVVHWQDRLTERSRTVRRLRFGTGALVGLLVTAPATALLALGDRLAGLPFLPYDLLDWATRVLPGGGPWQQAKLRAPLSETTWVLWRHDWPFPGGRAHLRGPLRRSRRHPPDRGAPQEPSQRRDRAARGGGGGVGQVITPRLTVSTMVYETLSVKEEHPWR
jgi:hypothetical protein